MPVRTSTRTATRQPTRRSPRTVGRRIDAHTRGRAGTSGALALPPLLLALGRLVEGHGEHSAPSACLASALEDADGVVQRILVDDEKALEGNLAVSLIHERVAQAEEFRAIVKAIGDDMKAHMVVSEAAEQGLWLGMAIAFRCWSSDTR